MRASLVALLAAGLGACGGSDSGGGPAIDASCNSLAAGGTFCDDVAGMAPADHAAYQSVCNGMGYVYSTSPCPGANRVGTCTKTFPPAATGLSTAITVYERTYPPRSPADSQSGCLAAGGSWTAG